MTAVISKDGTSIAYDRSGRGPALILVDGALCYRRNGPSAEVARLLADQFTVFTYDRRGRGGSGDTAPYAVQREIEDLEALVKEAGGSAALYGVSSGAALILEAARQLPGIPRIVLFEAPFVVDNSRPALSGVWTDIGAAVAAGNRSRAVQLFLRAVGVPAFVVAIMRLFPVWKRLKAVAHTLPYDGALVREFQRGLPLPRDHWSALTMPALVLNGSKSPSWMRNAMQSLASVLPNATHRTLPGQTHIVKAAVHAPVISAFVSGVEDISDTTTSSRSLQDHTLDSETRV